MQTFYKDAGTLFKDISRNIVDDHLNDDSSVIQNSLFFAIGIEKLLKSILAEINPVFILTKPDFNNALSTLYGEKLVAANATKDEDVITLQNCILRVELVCASVAASKNALMKLKDARDIIVHHCFSYLNINELRVLLKRDFYPILSSIGKDIKKNVEHHFFNNLHSQLALISSRLQDDVEQQLRFKIEGHLAKWKVDNGGDKAMDEGKFLTWLMLGDESTYPTICPCCKNYAVVITEPILSFNTYIKAEIQVGIQVIKLECKFCKLIIDNYSELDFLKIVPDIDGKKEISDKYA